MSKLQSLERNSMDLKPGDRIELLRMPDELHPVKPGTRGTVIQVLQYESFAEIAVDWDPEFSSVDGRQVKRSLNMIVPPDEYVKVNGL